MAYVLVFLGVAALIGGILWNHNTSNAAMEGTTFSLPHDADRVTAAISAAHCYGARAKLVGFLRGVKVTPSGPRSFRTETKIGDVGAIEVMPADDGGCNVVAHTVELYVGSHPKTHSDRGWYGIGSAIVHRGCTLVGFAPNAVKMKRFQRGVEARIRRVLERSGATNARASQLVDVTCELGPEELEMLGARLSSQDPAVVRGALVAKAVAARPERPLLPPDSWLQMDVGSVRLSPSGVAEVTAVVRGAASGEFIVVLANEDGQWKAAAMTKRESEGRTAQVG